jgi:transposase-like protein
MVLETGKSIAEVARDLGIDDGSLRTWVRRGAWKPEPVPDLRPVERAREK